MRPKQLAAVAGFILVLIGALLMAAQAVWPEHFLNAAKAFQGFGLSLPRWRGRGRKVGHAASAICS